MENKKIIKLIIYGIVEILLWAVTLKIYEINVISIIYCIAISILAAIAVIDWKTYQIPVALNAAVGICGAAVMLIKGDECRASHIAGMLVVSMPLLLIYILTSGKVTGSGDVKLTAAIGLLLGMGGVVLAFLLGCLCGTVIHLLRNVLVKTESERGILPMGTYLAAGAIIVIW